MTQRGNEKMTQSPFATYSILLVSTLPDFCIKLRSAMFRAKNSKAYTLQVHLCETVKQVTDSVEIKVQVDFVVFGLDIEKSNCIEQVKQDLKLLTSRFLTSGDYCMVISTRVPASKMGVTWDSLQDLQTRYQMPLINGDAENEDKCNYLGQRILRLIESVKGVHSGFPLFNASTLDVHGEESVVARRHLNL